MKKARFFFAGVLFILSLNCDEDAVLNPSQNLTQVPVMDFIFNSDDYTRLLSNRTNSLKVPVKIYFDNDLRIAEVRASGAASRYDPRWSYRVILRPGETIRNLPEFTLSAQVNDPTMFHTATASELYRRTGFPLFHSEHVFLRINQKDAGLYVLLEVISEPFFKARNLSVNELYKVGFGSEFSLEDANELLFTVQKEIPDDQNFSTLIQFVEVLHKSRDGQVDSILQPYLDIRNYLTYHALTTLINNGDAFRNNFYLWRETPVAPFRIIPWDFDLGFQRNRDAGFYGKNAIIEKLLKNQYLFDLYKDLLRMLITDIYTQEIMFPVIDSTAAFISEAYQLDPYLGQGRYIFENEISALKTYISDRRTFFEENLDGFVFGTPYVP